MSDLVFSSWCGATVDSRKEAADADAVSLPKALSNDTALAGVMGWDGIAVWGDVNVVDLARAYAEGLSKNSCGQCVPCRIGTEKAVNLVETEGAVSPESEALLRRLDATLRKTSLCGLGHVALSPLLSILSGFPDESGRPG